MASVNVLTEVTIYLQVYWVGPILGALLGGITFEYSHVNYTGSRLLRRSSSTRDDSGLEARASSKESVDLPTELTFSVNMPDDPEVWLGMYNIACVEMDDGEDSEIWPQKKMSEEGLTRYLLRGEALW